MLFFFFKQKTAYEMRISDWSSDVCSSDLRSFPKRWARPAVLNAWMDPKDKPGAYNPCGVSPDPLAPATLAGRDSTHQLPAISASDSASTIIAWMIAGLTTRSEEHTSELQSLMRISYAVFCLKKKKNQHNTR